MSKEKKAGVLGGMGPDATVDFMAKVIALSSSDRDQDHIHMIVDHNPKVPDRRAAMHGESKYVAMSLATMVQRLQGADADFLVMVCNTAHLFLDEVHRVRTVPFISIVEESVREIARVCPSAAKVGLMATTGCVRGGIYQSAISAADMDSLLPDAVEQKHLMSLIDAIKAGNQGEEVAAAMQSIADQLVNNGADVVVAGCTEIPIVFGNGEFRVPVIASTDVLAKATVDLAKGIRQLPQN